MTIEKGNGFAQSIGENGAFIGQITDKYNGEKFMLISPEESICSRDEVIEFANMLLSFVGEYTQLNYTEALGEVRMGQVQDEVVEPKNETINTNPITISEAIKEFVEAAASDIRPANCRNRLRDEMRAYPKSGCGHCKTGGLTGCPFEASGSSLMKSINDLSNMDLSKIVDREKFLSEIDRISLAVSLIGVTDK